MKNLYPILLISMLLSGSLLCMEKPAVDFRKIPTKHTTCREYIEVDQRPLLSHGGSKLRFYKEYPSRIEDGKVSFPLTACDPLPLNTFGPIRYFFVSATGGNILTPGSAIKVEDPSITNIVVVRGKDDGIGNRLEAYLGYSVHDFKPQGAHKKIFIAQLLAITTKNRGIETRTTLFAPAIGNLNNMDLSREIRNHLENMKDWDWKSPIFKQTMLKLLGEGWVLREGYNCWFCTRDEAIVSNGGIYTNKIYWTQEENKLKGIRYNNKN